MDFVQIAIVIVLLCLLVKPLGTYLYNVFSNEPNKTDRIYGPVERFLFKLGGIRPEASMSWKKYMLSILLTNAVLIGLGYLVLRLQNILPFNPNGIGRMEETLSFNTIISFMTNTNLQGYSGESGLSYFSQMIVITMMMFTSAATGFSVAAAFIRGITGKGKGLGNFFQDFVKTHTRILLPFAFVITLILVALHVPQTLEPTIKATTLEGAVQNISVGPVASLESIKHLGTNGGGFFGVNSSHPFENPNGITNVIEILSMWMFPAALTYTYGLFAQNKRQGWVIFSAMLVLFLVFLGIEYAAESQGNPLLNNLGVSAEQGSPEGKEVRFGLAQSALFTTVTTSATTGTVNNMHDTLTPLGGMVPTVLMMLNSVFGGNGIGLVNMLMYAILAVFLAGLMIGRTPEFLGRKIEAKEMKLIAIVILLHPFIILVPTAIALVTDAGQAGITNPGFHGITQVLYQYTSSAANNGSGFEGLADNTPFWDITTGIVMLLGRYISMIALLGVAGSLAAKHPVPETIGTFKTDNKLFMGLLIGTVLIIGALTFLPVLVLGPVAEYLTIR